MANTMIIGTAELQGIANEFGPHLAEDVAYLRRRGVPANQGSGKTKPNDTLLGPYGARIIYVGNQNVREKMRGAQISADADYLIDLPAGTLVVDSDIVVIKANLWLANTRYVPGQKVVPTDSSNHVLLCNQAGISGSVEPTWNTAVGATNTDNTINWVCNGPGQEFQIIQIAAPTTYSGYFSVKLACTLFQRVAPP